MKASIEISLYPLQTSYETPILNFIERLNAYDQLNVRTNVMSTQVVGDYDILMTALAREIKTSFQEEGTKVLVMKLINLELHRE